MFLLLFLLLILSFISRCFEEVEYQAPRVVCHNIVEPCRPVASLLIAGGGLFLSDFGHFQGLKIGVSSGCLRQTSIFKILILDFINFIS